MSNQLVFCEALNKYDLFKYFEIWFNSTATGNQLSKIKFVTWRVACGWNFVLVIRTCMLRKLAQTTSLHPNSGPWQTFTRIWSVVFIPKSDSWVIYVLMVAFHDSLKLRALFVLYAKKTPKRCITTLLSVPLLGIIIILRGLT